ncbi:MAG: hypothetical protein WC374_09155 [Phycisphaerae bacterium]|jgi:hypothetical protein
MAKHPQRGENVTIAPGISCRRTNDGQFIFMATKTGNELYPINCLEDKIMIFEKQVNGWFLEQAQSLINKRECGFVVLLVATAYIEGIEQFRKGTTSNGQNRDFFIQGIRRIFEIEDENALKLQDLYSQLRCELFHNGMTGPYIRISSEYEEPIELSESRIIKINQNKFLEKVKNDFEQYLINLRDKNNQELRDNFNRIYTFE